MSAHRLTLWNSAGELMDRIGGSEAELREMAERMGGVYGQKRWKFDLYEGGTLRATYKRGTWTEHGESKQ